MTAAPLARFALGTFICVTTACSTATYHTADQPTRATSTRMAAVTLRSLDERALARESHRSLADVLRAYWPNVENPPWMERSVALREIDRLGVYSAQGDYLGGLAQVADITASRIANVQRLTPGEEAMRFGRTHAAGALVIQWAR